MATRTGPKIF
jgi:hypothetical protein